VFSVEIRIAAATLAEQMEQMRTWLDSRGCAPRFVSIGGRGASHIYRVDFEARSDAVAFAEAFGGRLLRG
jgi:hypothetical protein